MAVAYEKTYALLAQSLLLELVVVKTAKSSPQSVVNILTTIMRESENKEQPMTVSILATTKIGKALTKTAKVCKRHKYQAISSDDNGDKGDEWERAIHLADSLVNKFREAADAEHEQASASKRKTAKDESKSAATTQSSAGGRREVIKLLDPSGRPKRKLKSVARFADTQSFDSVRKKKKEASKNSCKTGHGFVCPRCSSVNSYESKGCVGCSLECYYEAGVGVVVLKERDDMSARYPRKRKSRDDAIEIDAKGDDHRKGPPEEPELEKSNHEKDTEIRKVEEAIMSNSHGGAMIGSKSSGEGGKLSTQMADNASGGLSAKSMLADGDKAMVISTDEKYPAPKTSTKMNEAGVGKDNEATPKHNDNDGVAEDQHMDRYCQPISPVKGGSLSEESLPPSLYKRAQRVLAKDDDTGLLYQAMVRKVLWGPKSNQNSMGCASSLVDGTPCGGNVDDPKSDNDEDEDEGSRRWNPKYNSWHYYVHYMGWAVRWDRWVEEKWVYDDSASSVALAKTLMSEYNKIKPKKRGQKMSIRQVEKWMKRMVEIEDDHRSSLNGRGGSVNDEGNSGSQDGKVFEPVNPIDKKEEESGEIMNEHFNDDTKKADTTMGDPLKSKGSESEDKPVKMLTVETTQKQAERRENKSVKRLTVDTLQKQAELRENGLQTNRKKSISDRLLLPFNLKKVLVEEWEVITQCDMIHHLPSRVTVRDALNQYLESKLVPLRQKMDNEKSKSGKNIEKSNGKNKCSELGKEWINMVEGIALFFDQALPVHLLFGEERRQYNCLRRQILAQRRSSSASTGAASKAIKSKEGPSAEPKIERRDSLQSATTDSSSAAMELSTVSTKETKPQSNERPDSAQSATSADSGTNIAESTTAKSPPPDLLPERMSEIYGCEYLLRLFVRLPGVVAEAPVISQSQSRQIFSKLGDLVRYLQKHQGQLFCSSFRRPLPGESRSSGASPSNNKTSLSKEANGVQGESKSKEQENDPSPKEDYTGDAQSQAASEKRRKQQPRQSSTDLSEIRRKAAKLGWERRRNQLLAESSSTPVPEPISGEQQHPSTAGGSSNSDASSKRMLVGNDVLG